MANVTATKPKISNRPGTPIEPGPPTPTATLEGELGALRSDLRLLDERLAGAVEQLRVALGGTDATQRGLIIEEGDVDRWLSSLGSGEAQGLEAGIAAPGESGGRLGKLRSVFGLNNLQLSTILTALAPEVDLAYGNLYAYVQDDVTRKNPTLDLVATLWCQSPVERVLARRLLEGSGALRRHLLVEAEQSGSPVLSWPLHLDARIASYLLSSDEPDPQLAGAAVVLRPQAEQGVIAAYDPQVQSLAQLVELHAAPHPQDSAQTADAATRRGLVGWLRGPERAGKLDTARQLAASLGTALVIIDTPLLVATQGDLYKRLYRAFREAQLQEAVLLWRDADTLAAMKEGASPEWPPELARLLQNWQGCVLFDVGAVAPLHLPSGPLSILLEFPAPSNDERRRLWERALAGTRLGADVDLGLITGAFRLTGEQIASAADTARHSAAWQAATAGLQEDGHVTMHDLLTSCRANSNRGLGAVARHITPMYTWADLVLPADRLAQLHEMCLHVRFGPLVFEHWGFEQKLSRGRGLSMLFAGQPGTGKTMAAEVIATDLGLELYKIDLSTVVSKYIGETEKNLEKIFNEGQTSNAILFFDEADSLFGKRSEVKDAHDRYANIETSYLLQRMEEYDGIVILATNLRKNLDDAFIRRLHGAIEFPMPEEQDRLEIWRRTFPREAPLGPDIALEFLAKGFKLSGGNIKNIVLESAFYAAEAGASIGMAHLVRATRREHQKIGRLLHIDDFGPYADMIKGANPVEMPNL